MNPSTAPDAPALPRLVLFDLDHTLLPIDSDFEWGEFTQRIGWTDYKTDYSEFSDKISDEHFPRGGAWLMMGPTGPRRLRLAIEQFIEQSNEHAHPFRWDQRSAAKIMAWAKRRVELADAA